MDSDLETPRRDVDFNDTDISHSFDIGKYQHDEPYLQVPYTPINKVFSFQSV